MSCFPPDLSYLSVLSGLFVLSFLSVLSGLFVLPFLSVLSVSLFCLASLFCQDSLFCRPNHPLSSVFLVLLCPNRWHHLCLNRSRIFAVLLSESLSESLVSCCFVLMSESLLKSLSESLQFFCCFVLMSESLFESLSESVYLCQSICVRIRIFAVFSTPPIYHLALVLCCFV